MKERPILFRPEMVRAILEGRKTQTRRVVSPAPIYIESSGRWRWPIPKGRRHPGCSPEVVTASREWWEYLPADAFPYGAHGDRLWVRETWREDRQYSDNPDDEGKLYGYLYRADPDEKDSKRDPWRPAIHMPREASRILLEITGTRAERLKKISEADAAAEGVEPNCDATHVHECPPCRAEGKCRAAGEYIDYTHDGDGFPAMSARESYRSLWDSINAERGFSWEANPWVWVVEFKVVESIREAA